MNGLPDRNRDVPEPTPAGLLAGLFVSVLAVRFARAAWAAARREGARQRMASNR